MTWASLGQQVLSGVCHKAFSNADPLETTLAEVWLRCSAITELKLNFYSVGEASINLRISFSSTLYISPLFLTLISNRFFFFFSWCFLTVVLSWEAIQLFVGYLSGMTLAGLVDPKCCF